MSQADDRRERIRVTSAQAAGLGGWFLSVLNDGITESGEACYWYTYEHLDGRQATVFPDGHCTDPELQALLVEQAATAPAAPGFPWWLRLVASAISRWQRGSNP
jgi:hypothetical protein